MAVPFINGINAIGVHQLWGFLGGSVVKKKKKKCLSMQEIQFQSLVREEPLEEEMATHLGILAWDLKSHEHRSLAGYSPWGCTELDTT